MECARARAAEVEGARAQHQVRAVRLGQARCVPASAEGAHGCQPPVERGKRLRLRTIAVGIGASHGICEEYERGRGGRERKGLDAARGCALSPPHAWLDVAINRLSCAVQSIGKILECGERPPLRLDHLGIIEPDLAQRAVERGAIGQDGGDQTC